MTAVIFVVIMWLSTAGATLDHDDAAALGLTPAERSFPEADGFAEVHDIVLGRSAMYQAQEPVWDGLRWAPNGLYLELESDIAREARMIYLKAGISHAMPTGNLTFVAPEERAAVVHWYRRAEGS